MKQPHAGWKVNYRRVIGSAAWCLPSAPMLVGRQDRIAKQRVQMLKLSGPNVADTLRAVPLKQQALILLK